jgi:hypothetical protein
MTTNPVAALGGSPLTQPPWWVAAEHTVAGSR